ncbi:hypothetical protein B0H13DRAFT_1850577 [Mycena leptocephala]|nr:hypothetical protein B0H13DRAFT_1850577 [Mycena leptocephala]
MSEFPVTFGDDEYVECWYWWGAAISSGVTWVLLGVSFVSFRAIANKERRADGLLVTLHFEGRDEYRRRWEHKASAVIVKPVLLGRLVFHSSQLLRSFAVSEIWGIVGIFALYGDECQFSKAVFFKSAVVDR